MGIRKVTGLQDKEQLKIMLDNNDKLDNKGNE